LNSELRDVFKKSKNRINKDLKTPEPLQKHKTYLAGIEILEFYFIKRRQILRLIFIFAFSLVGLVLSIYWEVEKISFVGFTAYFIFFFTILISEIVIYRWRNIRDITLRPLAAELSELSREDDINPK